MRLIRFKEWGSGFYLLMSEVACIYKERRNWWWPSLETIILPLLGDIRCCAWALPKTKCLKIVLMCVLDWPFLQGQQTLQPTLQRKGMSHPQSMSIRGEGWENGLSLIIYQHQPKLFILDLLCSRNLYLHIYQCTVQLQAYSLKLPVSC